MPDKQPEFAYRAVITEVKMAGQNAAFSAIIAGENNEVALAISALFPREFLRAAQPEDFADIVVRLRKKEDVEAEVAAAQTPAAESEPAS